jgi:hypothetical protein
MSHSSLKKEIVSSTFGWEKGVTLGAVAAKIDGFDVSKKVGRRFYRELKLIQVAADGGKKARCLWLFNDILVWTSTKSLFGGLCGFKGLQDLRGAECGPSTGSSDEFFVRSPAFSASYVVKSTKVRDTWVDAVNESIAKASGGRVKKTEKKKQLDVNSMEMPNPNTVNRLFENLCAKKGFSEAIMDNLRKQKLEQKWKLICLEGHVQDTTEQDGPGAWAEILGESRLTFQELQTFSQLVKSCDTEWLKKFDIEFDGFAIFAAVFARMETHQEWVSECMQICRAFVKNNYGTERVSQSPALLHQLVVSSKSNNSRVVEMAFTVLIVVCWLGGNNEGVYEEFVDLAQSNRVPNLSNLLEPLTHKALEIKISGLLMVNTIINTCYEFERRQLMRRELFDGGLEDVLAQLKKAIDDFR